jgi:4-phytase / acid phosphatase
MNGSRLILVLWAWSLVCVLSSPAAAPAAIPSNSSAAPTLVVILTRHGVRSPTQPAELAAYASRPWPAWEVAPGFLTPRGADLMRQFGSYYRRFYASLFPTTGCPPQDSIFVWADVDQRTLATGSALLDGMAKGCGVSVMHASGKSDILFDPLPALGKADSVISNASVRGAVGDDPNALGEAYASAYATLDRVLGCVDACKRISQLPTTIDTDPDTGLASLSGGLDAAGTAAENLLLEYADGHSSVGWGEVDGSTVLQLMSLHALKARIEHETYYNARAEGSNLLSHVMATIDQAASGRKNPSTRVPLDSRLAIIVGHDTSLSKFAGMLHLSWLMAGYQVNDTPPGGALVFELYRPANASAFVRLFFTAQTLPEMRGQDGTHPGRVPVYIPGCPSLDCPLSTLDTIVRDTTDPRFIGPW